MKEKKKNHSAKHKPRKDAATNMISPLPARSCSSIAASNRAGVEKVMGFCTPEQVIASAICSARCPMWT